MISMVDVGVIKQIMKVMGSIDASVAIKDTIFVVIIARYRGNHQNKNDIQQPKQNQFVVRSGMIAYNTGVIHCDYIPYNACFTGMYCIIPLFR